MKTISKVLIFATAGYLLMMTGCAVTRVKPWEHDQLAQKKMHPVPDPVQKSYDDHIYFSEEASTGGQGVGGGEDGEPIMRHREFAQLVHEEIDDGAAQRDGLGQWWAADLTACEAADGPVDADDGVMLVEVHDCAVDAVQVAGVDPDAVADLELREHFG